VGVIIDGFDFGDFGGELGVDAGGLSVGTGGEEQIQEQ